jgi:hypothetical protein
MRNRCTKFQSTVVVVIIDYRVMLLLLLSLDDASF